MLDFVDELVEWVTEVPLLVVGTARPELLARRPDWGGGKLDATTVALTPLTDEQTAALISGLLKRPVLADEQRKLLGRAEGNPLYAEQFAELYLERGSADDLPLPETLQGVIAARLDGLDGDEKALLQDAAVVGKVFWSGSLGRDPDAANAALHSLDRKGFVRRQRQSSIERESEYAFGHALVRDVAYGQIPRAERAVKHRQVAAWIESLGRTEDHAEMLVHHAESALELIGATGGDDRELVALARRSSVAAGDRAVSLNAFLAAAAHYQRAVDYSLSGETDVPALLFRRAEALFTAGDDGAAAALAGARDALVAAGDRLTAAEAEALLGRLNWLRGSLDDVFPHLDAAEQLIKGAEASVAVARVLSWSARQLMLAGERERSLVQAREALELAERLGLDEIRVHALTTIGSAKEFRADSSGRDDLRQAIELARAIDSPLLPGALNNLSVVLDSIDAQQTESLQREALAEAFRFGDLFQARFYQGNVVASCYWLGKWDEAVGLADEFIAECERGSPHLLEGPTRLFRGYIRLARGDRDAVVSDFERALELGREHGDDPQHLVPALVRTGWAYLQIGRSTEALVHFNEALPLFDQDIYAKTWTFAELAYDLGETAAARRILSQLPPTPGHRAMLAVLDGDFATSAELYGEAGIALFEAESHLRHAEQLFAAGRIDEGGAALEQALGFYRPIGATLFVERGERLLAREAAG
jgi:tetratricopeptide (TPR) repeat protein